MRSDESAGGPLPVSGPIDICWLTPGAPPDGVHGHSCAVAKHLAGGRLVQLDPRTESARRVAARCTTAQAVIVTYTDRLHDLHPERLRTWWSGLRRHLGRPVVAMMHDVPQAGEGDERFRGRLLRYMIVASEADAVVVSSDHEAIGMSGALGRSVHVAWHYLDYQGDLGPSRGRASARFDRPTVAILGFVHPGKRFDLVLDAAAGLGSKPDVVALGGPSKGQENFARELTRSAAERNQRFELTGTLSEERLDRLVRMTTVPIAAFRHVAASGSIGRWVGAGRRPLVTANGFATEFDRRHPGCIELVEPTTTALRRALRRRLADPASNWHGQHLGPFGPASTAAALEAIVRRVVLAPETAR